MVQLVPDWELKKVVEAELDSEKLAPLLYLKRFVAQFEAVISLMLVPPLLCYWESVQAGY